MKHVLLFLVLLSAFPQLLAQNKSSISAWFDSNWKPLNGQEGATFYRTIEPTNGKFLVRDYFMSGHLQMEQLCDAVKPKLIWYGKATLYHETGKVAEEGVFKDEIRQGLHKFWYPDGAPMKEVFYQDTKQIYYAFWSPEGKSLLHSGIVTLHEVTPLKEGYLELQDSMVVGAFQIDPVTADTLYVKCQRTPEYEGGLEKLFDDVQSVITYPRAALKAGIHGVVEVKFMVTRNGSLKDVGVMNRLGGGCDEEAIRVVSQLRHWKPARQFGKPVQMNFILPIYFPLK